MMEKESIFLTKTNIINRTGWSKTLADRLLGDPDKTKKHSTYKTMISLYKEDRVLEIEKTSDFISHQVKLSKRREAAKKAVKTKKERLINEIESMDVKIVSMSMKHVRKQAINAYNEWNIFEGKFASDKDDQDFLDRITVNYIRHELTDYDQTLYELSGKTGSFEARELIWKKIFGAICKTYPALEKECQRQLEAKLNPVW